MSGQLTLNNYFQFGYDNATYNIRQTAHDKFWVRHERCQRPIGSFKDECLSAAQIIYDLASSPLALLFSGGMDSEVMVRSFHKAKVPFKIYIIQFMDNKNNHDTAHAFRVCEELNMTPIVLELDIKKFFNSELGLKYMLELQSNSPARTPIFWALDQIDEYPVLGQGEAYLVKRSFSNIALDYRGLTSDCFTEILCENSPDWDLWEEENVLSWYRYFIIRDRPGAPGFFQFTPELFLSQIKDTTTLSLITNQIEGKVSNISSKYHFYSRHFPLKERVSYNGLEQVKHIDKIYRELYKATAMHQGQVVRIPHKIISQQLEYASPPLSQLTMRTE